MTSDEPSSIQTRPSLLGRVKSGADSESWNEFYRIYARLVHDFAIQAGLNDAEADDIVQETFIGISRHLPEYRYDPKVCRFKTWLLNQTSWRIKDQLKRHRRAEGIAGVGPATVGSSPAPCGDDSTRTDAIHRVPDPGATDLDALFETQWREKLFAAALERVKEKFTLKQFQVFDLLVLKEWAATEVAQSLGITVANVYVTRHRISAAVKKEVRRLESQFEQSLQSKSKNQSG
jgi:RNA polymerase sigma-70 factor (ECF subfamily)